MAQPARASLACLGAAASPVLWMPLALEPLRAPEAPLPALSAALTSLIALLSGEPWPHNTPALVAAAASPTAC